MIRGFLRNESGNMSMELLIVLPLFATILIGSFAFWDAFRSQSQTAKVAYAVSDILSRYDVVDDADMVEIVALTNKMLDPSLDRRVVRITSICFADDKFNVLWSYTSHASDVGAVEALTDNTIPLDFMPTMSDQESIILTELQVRWRPIFDYIGLTEQTWSNTLVTRPRFTMIMPHSSLNPASTCPIDTSEST
ncbi:pilus assembly protein [Rhodobacteraceae bacterium NNCM2]|nr:pilus assembly protein [Coraliihabitans acroporae]